VFAILADFIYKMLYAPMKIKTERYASSYTFVKIFNCDSISTIWRAVVKPTNAARRFVDTSASLPFAFTLTPVVGFDNL